MKKRQWRAVENDNATNTWDFISHDDLVFRVYGFGVVDKKMEDVIALIAWSPDMYNLLDRIRNGEAVSKTEINETLKWIDDDGTVGTGFKRKEMKSENHNRNDDGEKTVSRIHGGTDRRDSRRR